MSDRAMHNLELDDELVLLCDEAEAALSLGMVEQAAELFGRAARPEAHVGGHLRIGRVEEIIHILGLKAAMQHMQAPVRNGDITRDGRIDETQHLAITLCHQMAAATAGPCLGTENFL